MIENKEEIRKKIIEILDEFDLVDADNIIEMDSIQFMHIIVEIEKIFNISIPYEYLAMGKLNSIDDYIKTIEECKKRND